MDGKEFKRIRKSLGMDRLTFARALGYRGSDRNAATDIERIEHGKSGISTKMSIRALELEESKK